MVHHCSHHTPPQNYTQSQGTKLLLQQTTALIGPEYQDSELRDAVTRFQSLSLGAAGWSSAADNLIKRVHANPLDHIIEDILSHLHQEVAIRIGAEDVWRFTVEVDILVARWGDEAATMGEKVFVATVVGGLAAADISVVVDKIQVSSPEEVG